MAIQHRRGSYTDFDPTKMKPGEFAVVQTGDPDADDGEAVYMAFDAGEVKRLATHDEMERYNLDAHEAADAAEQSAQESNRLYQLTARAQRETQELVDSIPEEFEEAVQDGINTIGDAADEMLEEINIKGQQILAIKTEADRTAAQALDTANNAENHMATLDSQMRRIQAELEDVSIDVDDLGLYQDPDTYYVYPTYKGRTSENGIPLAGGSGGGGGGDVIDAVLTVENTSGWLSKTIASGSNCPVSFTWSSIEDEMPTGDGTMRITVNEVVRATFQISQGSVSVDLKPYLSTGSNKVKVRISDTYDQGKTTTFNITSVELSISSSFDASTVYSSAISFPYTPVGAVEKTVYFVVDGRTIGTQVTSVSNRQMSYTIPAQTHGGHSLRVYFEATINGETVRSNELYYEFIFVDALSDEVIITSNFSETTQPQYANIVIPYQVYDPKGLSAEVKIYANNELMSTQTVDRTEQSYTYRANDYGTLNIDFKSGNTTKRVTITVTESEIDVEAETENLALYLTSQGRSNNEEHPEIWEDEDNEISASLTGFNFSSDGWQADNDGITCLRVSGSARVVIPYKLFETDFRTTGKTIELEFATRNVIDYDATILSCWSDGRGLSLTPQRATIKSEQSELYMQYKEDEHIRVAFVAEKRAENRLLLAYIDGIPSGVVQYPTDDDFSQTTPVNISIGSNDCTIDLYCIRVYDNDLTRHQILDNWIADTQNATVMLDRYTRNNVFDAYGNIVIANLPANLPYFILNAPELPQYKGDKKTISGSYVNRMLPSKSFTFDGCQINVQGTSSAPYYRKNYDMQFKNGFELAVGHADNYELQSGNVPFNRFVLKADVASSEGANNVELVRLYNDVCPYKTPEMVADPRVRWGIDGFPIVVFWNNTDTGQTSFLGKYNFNLPKRAPGPYGYADSETMESWEFQNNTSDLMVFKTDYFDETMYTDPDTGDTKELWRYDYEARFPKDTWTDYSTLQEFQSFVYSTYRAKATGDALDEPVTYEEVEYTHDTAEYRLAKFRNEFPTYAELNTFLFYYIFTELLLMVDSRAKNLFIGFNGSNVTVSGRVATRKATAQPYDMDTGLGTNNEGSLVFGYSLEDTDHLTGGVNIFNGQDSVLWCNVRDAFGTEIRQMYQTLRSGGTLSYNTLENRYETHQSKWPEAVWIEDSWFKYLYPLISPDAGKEPTAVYLPMMQGSKEQQRKWWLTNRFKYMDSKWNAGDALSQVIQLRGYAKDNITVTPYTDIYPTVKYASYVVQERGEHGQPTTLVCPLSTVNDTEIYIYSAPQIASVGDLSGLKVGFADFSQATRLQSIKIGDSTSGYDNPNLGTLSLGSNALLKTLDVRNCSGLGDTTIQGHSQQTVDLSGCSIIENIYFDGTKITGVTLPNGGVIKVLHLPNTITNLTIMNQKLISDLTVSSYANITTLRLENVPTVNSKAILNALDISKSPRVRLIGFYWECEDATEIRALFTRLDSMRGLDESGNNVETAQVSGTIHTDSLTGAEIAEFNAEYPYVNVTADHTSSTLSYYNGTTLLHQETVLDGGNGAWTGTATKTQDAQYTYAFAGWSKTDDNTVDADARDSVVADRSVYACFTPTLRKYTVTFIKASADGGGTLQTISNVNYGTTITAASSYTGATPTSSQGSATDYPFEGWNPASATVQGDTVFTAKFGSPVEVAEITDSWDTIIANIDNGTYATKYKVGNYKPIDLGSTYGSAINMQIVAIDGDELADGSGTAPLTFISKELLSSRSAMNSSNTYVGGYPATNVMKPLLDNTIYPLIPSSIRTRIQRVSKTSWDANTGATLTSTEKLWIPSCREMFGGTNYETSGVVYSSIFKSTTDRIKTGDNVVDVTQNIYWLRSAHSKAGMFRAIGSGGNTSSSYAANRLNIALGFCLGLEPETIEDDWSTILANQNYATDYSIGDTKYLDLGTQGKHLMEIVAIDTDDRADGNGKAGLTWISKTLLNTSRVMNSSQKTVDGVSGYAIGGWEYSDMRSYMNQTIKPLIPATVRNAIVSVSKTQRSIRNTSDSFIQNTIDDVWIPSLQEMTNLNPTEGYYYSKFSGSNLRKKRYINSSSTASYWLRTTDSSNKSNFSYIGHTGGNGSYRAMDSYAIALGFCTN